MSSTDDVGPSLLWYHSVGRVYVGNGSVGQPHRLNSV